MSIHTPNTPFLNTAAPALFKVSPGDLASKKKEGYSSLRRLECSKYKMKRRGETFKLRIYYNMVVIWHNVA